MDHQASQTGLAELLLIVGVFTAIAMSLSGAARQTWTRGKSSEAVAVVEAVFEDHEVPARLVEEIARRSAG